MNSRVDDAWTSLMKVQNVFSRFIHMLLNLCRLSLYLIILCILKQTNQELFCLSRVKWTCSSFSTTCNKFPCHKHLRYNLVFTLKVYITNTQIYQRSVGLKPNLVDCIDVTEVKASYPVQVQSEFVSSFIFPTT